MPADSAIRIVPVLDVMGGVVVRGIGGKREAYRPLVSRLCETAEPIAVAEAIRARFGFETAYLADLDAILGGRPAWDLYGRLQARGFRLWVDAGIRTAEDAAKLVQTGVEIVILGSETLAGPGELRRIAEIVSPERLAFSLDLKTGKPLGNWADSPPEMAAVAIAAGIRRLIVLDLARVGIGQGVGTESLLADLSRRFPGIELIAGGGIRGKANLDRLQECGAAAALVASALHDGRFGELSTRRD